MKATIRLFKAIPIESKEKGEAIGYLLEKTIQKGFVFSPEVIGNYLEKELIDFIMVIENEVGLTLEQMNASFHKSWKKIKDADIEQLIMEQIIHYFTTYGFERLGIYDEESVYIPREQLELPDIDIDEIRLVVIRGYTKDELKEKLMTLLKSGVALKEDTLRDVIDIALFVRLNEQEIEKIKNKEVKSALYDYLNLFPQNPTEFLRHLVYRSIGKTLLIKNQETIDEIKSKDNLGVLGLLKRYDEKHGLKKLAEIFLRFKPIFLAFKGNPQLNQHINKIRRLAKKYHKPMKVDFLNNVTTDIKWGKKINPQMLKEELAKVNVFRKIRLAYALKFRTKDVDSILYRIRNGKGYATEFEFYEKKVANNILHLVLDSIINDISKNVKGKKIYIPQYIEYTLPSTEKQFTGDLPSGTCVSIPSNMIVGIHWENIKNNRIDLDLSIISPETDKIGWDGSYRTNDRMILFSGDVTDAPKRYGGASELFYVQKPEIAEYIMFVNYYNHDASIEVPFKIMVAKEHPDIFENNYMINPTNVLSIAKTKINRKQKVLGLLITTKHECKFYFAETYLGSSITSSRSEFIEHGRKYLLGFYRNTISLNEILEGAGGILVHNNKECDIDLSIENLEKDKIMRLLI